MTGKKNSVPTDPLIEQLLERVNAALAKSELPAHMALHPQSAKASYFIAAPRPRMTRQDMERIATDGVFAEMERVLADVPAATRAELTALLEAASAKLKSTQAANESAEPSSLIYTIH